MRAALDNPWLNRAGNLVFLAGAIQTGVRLLMGLSLNAVGAALFVAGLLLMVAPYISKLGKRRHPQAEVREPPMRPGMSAREDKESIVAEFVTMIEEGKKLCEGEFVGDPPWRDYGKWRSGIMEFVGSILGDAERQRFIEVEPEGSKPSDHITAVMDWLRERRDHPDRWTPKIWGDDLAAAISKRYGTRTDGGSNGNAAQNQPSEPLAGQLDALMREGMELLDELMAPAEAEETGEGVWALDFGDAPAEWWDKADAFYKKVRDLLVAEHPALLPDLERGYNERLRIQREAVASRQPNSHSTAEKMLAFATETQRTPAKIVEACLEGLSQARKSI